MCVVPDPIYTFPDRCVMCSAGRSVLTGLPCYTSCGITVQPLPLSVGVYSEIAPFAPYSTWPVGFDRDGATVPT
jgi:hypothetical protein